MRVHVRVRHVRKGAPLCDLPCYMSLSEVGSVPTSMILTELWSWSHQVAVLLVRTGLHSHSSKNHTDVLFHVIAVLRPTPHLTFAAMHTRVLM